MSDSLSPGFVAVLRACREEINARFVLFRREFPDLEREAYLEFLRTKGDQLVRAVEAVEPVSVVETGRVVCEVGLELVARNLAGPNARHRWIDETWRCVLTAAAAVVAAAPHRVIASLSNAMHQLTSTREARPAQWLALMERAVPFARDVESLLGAGQVAAWRSGLTHYRDGALAVAERLEPALALAVLGADGDVASVLARLRENAWFDPGQSGSPSRLVARAGAFRGFGGPFLVPPVVIRLKGQWLAGSGDEHWLLTADAFGATFHRVTGLVIPPPLKADHRALAQLDVPPDCGEVTSVATDGSTTAVTASLTHAVLFFDTRS